MYLNVILALVLAAGSFYLGKTVADRYHDEAEQRISYSLARQYLRLKANMDADDPCRPYVYNPSPRRRIPKDLLTQIDRKLKTDGQATVQLNQKGDMNNE